MAVYDKVISGKFINMRSVTESDSEFIVKMRSDPEKYKYLHAPSEGYGVDMQNAWLKKQRMAEGDYYFIFEDKTGNRLGTVGLMNFKDGECESGRWVSYGNPAQNVESELLNYDFAFYELKLKAVRFWVLKENKSVISFHKQFGAEYVGETIYDGKYPSIEMVVFADRYENIRNKVAALLNRIKI